jgi:predicted nucleic acid-binding Zn ribbon protein
MKRTYAMPIGELLQGFYDENPQLKQKMLEMRIQRAWGEVLGPMVQHATRSIFVKNKVLYVALNSSVLRSELFQNRVQLLKNLNEYAGEMVIESIVIR